MEPLNDLMKHMTPRKNASRPSFRLTSPEESITPSRLEQLRTMPYGEYLQTPEWKEMRGYALEVATHRCQVCNSAKSLQVHHRTYERRGHENLEDLTVLCKACHELYHQTGKKDTKEHVHNFKITAKKHITIRCCKECGQSSILINGDGERQWQMIKE
jgi:5-methylcytosine-specific restriction endonuclease McrA